MYLTVVVDLFTRNVVGCSMKPTFSRELALDALMMAVCRRKPDGEVIVHSDQGSQYGSDYWQRFCRANNLAPSRVGVATVGIMRWPNRSSVH